MGLVRGAMRPYCLGGCSALVACVRRSTGEVGAGAWCCVFPVSPCPPRASCAVCGGPSCLGVPSPRSLVRHSMRSVSSAGSVRLPFWFSPRVLRRRLPPPPPRVGVACAPGTVPVLGAGRAVRLSPSPSACPASVPCSVWLAWGGRPGPVSSYLAWCCALPVGWVRAWGPVTNPSARALGGWPCALAWRAVGAARGRPGGGRPLPGCGAPGVGRSPTLDHSSFQACGRGPLPSSCGRGGCGRGEPWTTPQGALLRAGFARCGGGMWVPGGGRLLPGCGASGVGRSPAPNHSSFWACGRGPLPTGCGWGGCGHGDPSPTQQRALLRAGFARCGGGMRVTWGGASCLGVGRLGSGALPAPTTRPFGRAAGAHYPLAVGAGGSGLGTRHQPHSARSCELALRAVGAA